MAKNWKDVGEAFVAGFVAAYNHAAKQTGGFDGNAVRKQANELALQHIEILKQTQGKKNAAKAEEAPFDAIFEGKE